jgi:hypothetical protein
MGISATTNEKRWSYPEIAQYGYVKVRRDARELFCQKCFT